MRKAISACVQGASHKRQNLECQDSCKIDVLENGYIILAVADGHGSSSCPRSKQGSQFAVETFCLILKDLLLRNNDLSSISSYLTREGDTTLAIKIEQEWKDRVFRDYWGFESGSIETTADEKGLFKKYGTTLLGVVISDELLFSFQVGDGNIVIVDDDKVQPLIEPDKILGVETHSLSRKNAWIKAKTSLIMRNPQHQNDLLIIVSTDGFINSFASQNDYNFACNSYLQNIKEYGLEEVEKSLPSWLDETSELGSGDDITLALVYDFHNNDKKMVGCDNAEKQSEDNMPRSLSCVE